MTADTGSSPRALELESEAVTLIIRKGTPHISKAVVEGAFKKPPGSDSPCCFWNQVLYAPEDVSAMTGSTKKVKRDGSQEATSLEDSPNLVPTLVVSRSWALLTYAPQNKPPVAGQGRASSVTRVSGRGEKGPARTLGRQAPPSLARTWWVQAGNSLLFLLLKSSVCESRRQVCPPVCLSLSGQAAQEGLTR